MAIINRSDSDTTEEEAPPPQGIVPKSGARTTEQTQVSVNSTTANVAIAGSLKIVTAILVIGVLGAGGWFLSEQDLSLPSQDFDGQSVSLDIERAFRTRGLIDLLGRKIEQNKTALAMAEKSKDAVIADTMRLSLAQNLTDLDRHQDAYIETIVSLNSAHIADSDQLVQALKDKLGSATSAYKMGQADTVTEIIKLLQNAPTEQPIRTYLSTRLKPQDQE